MGSQLFAERARREHLRLARDQFELAGLLQEHAYAIEAEELRKRAASETAKYLRPPRRPRYLAILFVWAYLGVAVAFGILAELQTAAEAGPGPLVNWIMFGLVGLFCGVAIASVHIAMKDHLLELANRTLAMLTRGRLSISRPQSWPPEAGE